MINMKKKSGNWDNKIIISYTITHSNYYRFDEYHLVKSRDESLRANLAHWNFATYYL